MDPRVAFVASTVAGAIAPPDQKESYVNFLSQDGNGAIAAFLNDGSVSALHANVSGLGTGQLQLQLTNDSAFPVGCEYQIMLSKLRPGPVAERDIPGNIHVSTVSHTPLSSLYHAIKSVYGPMIDTRGGGDQAGGASMDPKLAELLSQLEAGLGSAVRKGANLQAAQLVDSSVSESLQSILTPLDEVDFWAELASRPGAAGAKAAQQVTPYMEGLRSALSDLASGQTEGGWEGVKEVVDQALHVMRQVWPIRPGGGQWAMPQPRTEHFLKVLGGALASHIQGHIKGSTLWTAPFSEIKPTLMGGSQIMAAWVGESKALTQDWAMGIDNGGHTWEGEPFYDTVVLKFQERMEEVYRIRETHDELSKLMRPEEAASLGLSEVFAPLMRVHALQVSDFGASAWNAAKDEYARRMQPVEQSVSARLRQMFSSQIVPAMVAAVGSGQGGATQPQQVFQDLKRYSGLLGMPIIASTLSAEKEALAKQVDKHLENLQRSFDSQQDAAARRAGGGVGSVMQPLMWSMQTGLKLKKSTELLHLMLGPGGARDGEDTSTAALRACLGVAQDLTREVDIFRQQQFKDWEENTQECLEQMSTWKSSRLMTFDARSSHVKTHFNEQVVSLLREVRQLQSLGLPIKRDVLVEVETAAKFYRYGMVLKQSANFYNNLATEMIPCQKPMMLTDAIEFEKVLMNPKDAQNREITWKNAASLDGYIRRLSEVADKLAERNRYLRKRHDTLRDKLVSLMGTDLVRYKDRWAAGVKEMRELFSKLEAEGYSLESQMVWRQYWDFQLYKALEYQYVQGLECINKTLPEVEIKMVFRQHKLQFEPPLEDVRMRHAKDFLNTFLGLPLRMKGVSDLSERPGFFQPIMDSNTAGIAKVYSAAEGLFAQLSDELKKFTDWLVLGSVPDLDEYVDGVLTEVADWELNFKQLKGAARDVERLPNDLKVDCYKVSLLPVKAAVEEHMKKLQEALVASLRRKTVTEKELVEEFIKNGGELFTKQCGSVEEIGLAGQEARGMVDGIMEIGQVRRRIDEKNKLLRAMALNSKDAQYAVVDMGEVNNQWDTFTTQLQQFDCHLEEQKVQLAGQIGKQLEDFKGRISGFASRWSELKPKDGPSGNPAVVLSRIEEYAASIEELKAEAAKLQKDGEAFKMDVGSLDALEAVAADVAVTKAAWDRYAEFLKERNEMANRDWLSMRDQVWKIEDFLTKWSKACEGKGKDDAIAAILTQEIDTYQRCLPHLKTSMRGAGWEDTHWLQLFKMIGLKTDGPTGLTKETVTLAHFLDVADAIVLNLDAIKKLDAQALGESMMRKALAELKLWGLQREFELTVMEAQGPSKAKKTPLIKEWRNVMAEVGDHQSMVASLKSSVMYHLFKDEVTTWEGKFGFLQEGLVLLNQVQRKWVYLEPIFARGALPAQQQRFRNVDEDFRRVMGTIDAAKKVVSFADIPGIRDKLPQMAQQLDVCQRALSDFLEEKRSSFPRFYFLGDDDLLEILGQSKNPTVIQSHLKKLFAGIHKVKFGDGSKSIGAMTSMDQEVVDFDAAVSVTDQIEVWLNELNNGMVRTLQTQLSKVQSGSMQGEFKAAASQILCLKEAVNFTASVEAALKGGPSGVNKYANDVRGQLQRLAGSDYTGQTLLQLKKQALVLDFIHYVDVCEQLVKAQCATAGEWAWRRQLRYYGGQPDGGVAVAMAEAKFQYSWEYQGNAPKLVYTPLTDKCYLVLTQGMALGYGGNPYGPAGTGKTESVKALGQAFARQVLVFNCDEQFDFKSMGRIFVGLVKCGAWGCFDEFNRLDEEVLSAVSQQIQQIQGALRDHAKSMTFMEKVVEVNLNAAIFVTLNPAGKGYGGRSKLTDNLKQLFRSIAMTVPDNELIAEVLLVSEGFTTAKDLARKLTSLFSLSKELLSAQQHYDWGLRALKTSLGIAGRELRDTRKQMGAASGGEAPPLDSAAEVSLIVRAVCATTLPKLTFDDNRRFRDLLADLFPGMTITDNVAPELEKAIKEVAVSLGLDLTDQQLEKIWQLHLACEQRIGVIIVGPSGSGKSTLWEVLERAYEKVGKKPITYKMNPKAMNRQQLLGSMNLDTREWSDGVLTAAARKVVKEPLEQRSWIICDGDVDPEWIESLNSVLDDNRLLTMPNGERIQFANNINFIFECHSLQFASPATVSRCGMIFLSDEAVDVDRVLAKWIRSHVTSDAEQMKTWCKDYLHKALEWALKAPRAVETTKVGLLDAALSHLAMGCGSRHDFACALARGLGANMRPETRNDFLSDLSRMTGETGLLDVGAYGADPLAIMGEELRELGPDEAGPLVQTEGVIQNLAMIAPWLKNREPFILVGPEGAGKSTLLEYCLARISGTQVATVCCSAQTNAANVIQKLVQVCGKPVTTNTGKCLRPPDNARIILYLKDINLPRPDKYQTAQLVAFLQQLLTHEGYYDEHLEFIRVERVQIIASINPPSTVGRHALSTRFVARVRVADMTYPDKDAMQAIYTQMLERSSAGMSISPSNLAAAMIEVYNQVTAQFASGDQAHYQFTPRDITSWVLGLRRYDLTSLTLPEAVASEGMRVFRDRLVEGAGEAFESMLVTVLSSMINFRGEVSSWVASTLGSSMEDRLSYDQSRLCLVKWSMDDFAGLVADKMKSFEREFKELHILLFPEVLARLARFDRVLSQPGGSLLLCGSSGVGRRSCMLLTAYMHTLEFVSPKMTKSYDVKAFRADLKDVLRKAGVEGKPTMLFLEDYQLEVDGSFLEYVNSLLSGGEIPGLFTSEELAKELMPLEQTRNDDQDYSGPPSLYAYFVHRTRKNLHVVVSMDPSNDLFRSRCESNPALITRASVQWLESWSHSGMSAIAAAKMEEMLNESQDVRAAMQASMSQKGPSADIVGSMVQMHAMMGASVQPREYVAFVNLYARIFSEKRAEVSEQRSFLKGGLSKLAEAEETVDILSKEADQKRGMLKIAQAAAEEALTHIQASMMTAADRSKEVEVLKKRQAVEEQEMKVRRSGVEEELKDVQPMIDEARKAVGNIKKENIDEIRSLKMPPEAIRDVLEGVITVLGQQDTSWNAMKKFLGGKSVKDEIINYDARKITPEMRTKVNRLLEQKGNSFQHAVIYRVSVAAAPLASWVVANMSFSKVLERVAPLENELTGLRESIENSAVLIQQYEAELKKCNEEVAGLKADFGKKTSEAETMRIGLEKAESTVTAAHSLLDKLGGEKTRWVHTVKTLDGDLQSLPLNSLLTSAFITYLPLLAEDQRVRIQGDWLRLLGIKEYDLGRFMSSESEMLKWKAEGLPDDGLSKQNAIIILNSSRTPMVIDPSSQASDWLRTHLGKHLSSVETTTMHDPRFSNTLELAVRFGKTLIIQEADRIEPLLYPLLRMDLDRQGPRFVVQIGDKQIDYNETFRLYLVTRNPEPYLPPDAASLIAATNFTVTRSGLEGQLLGLTIQQEQPELEHQKSELLKTEEDLKVQLADLEKTLLQALASSTGSLLENKSLLDSLNETKSKSITIAKSLEGSKTLQASLNEQREAYRPIAGRGSTMYFLIKDLSTLNSMYQFSLSAFLLLFKAALSEESAPGVNVTARIAVLNDTLVSLVINHVSRALFNNDRLTFGMHMACHMAGQGAVSPEEWNFFLGKVSADTAGSGVTPPTWVTPAAAGPFALLAANFPGLLQTAEVADSSVWSPWAAGQAGKDVASLPPKVAGKVTPFQSLLLFKTFQPDRLPAAMSAFVCNTLNIKSVAPSAHGVKHVLKHEARCDQPVLFITTPGADPSQELSEYANETVGRERYHEVAMGQGQAEIAVNLLRECARNGEWLCLKNVHLAVSWLPSLEKEVYTLQKHDNFRLFLTSESHTKFPKTLLELCLKVTFEAPPGMKKNMLRTYEGWSAEFLASGSPLRAQLLFILAWFHAVVQERRNYIPQGWSKFYEFSTADLRSGADIIELASKGNNAQWQLLHGLLENAIYGGRVDNTSDGKVLRTYLEQYFCIDIVGNAKGQASALPGSRVCVPTTAHRQDYVTLISELPENDVPALFSLPPNIDRSVAHTNSERLVSSLKQMSISREAMCGFNRAQWTAQLSPLLKLWEQLMANATGLRTATKEVAASVGVRAGASPVEDFVFMERGAGVRLVSMIDKQLGALSRVLRGQEVLSSSVQKLGQCLLADEVPPQWDRAWEGPEEPISYCRCVVRRAVAVETWWLSAKAGSLLGGGTPLDLSDLFHPGTFLNALRQFSARQLNIPLDMLKLASCWEAGRLQGANVVQVGGLQLQGANFDGQRFGELTADAPISRTVPPMGVAWVPKDAQLPYGNAFMPVPIYCTQDRSKVLTEVQMPVGSDDEVRQWTLRGLALFLSS
ncbi:hypothetical protein FOA52_013267 [Chlamydomonas sp. UWO 241]|nr:hypothetical protein FOA52_013267 [Chlamydomonas sp. UWO 241]